MLNNCHVPYLKYYDWKSVLANLCEGIVNALISHASPAMVHQQMTNALTPI